MTAFIIVSASRHAGPQHRPLMAGALEDLAALRVPEDVADGEIVLVHGAARGGDRMAVDIVKEWGWRTLAVPAKWEECGPDCPSTPHRREGVTGEFCPNAGPRRNAEMINRFKAEAVGMLAMPATGYAGGFERSGTWNAARLAADAGLLVVVRALAVPTPARRHVRKAPNPLQPALVAA